MALVMNVQTNKMQNAQRKLVSTVDLYYNGHIKLVGHEQLTRADMSQLFCDMHVISQQTYPGMFLIHQDMF